MCLGFSGAKLSGEFFRGFDAFMGRSNTATAQAPKEGTFSYPGVNLIMTTAIYAVSGDPWTKAHTNIVERSLQIVDRVIVAIGMNPKKNYAFPLEKRKSMAFLSIQHALAKYADRIIVDSFEGLLVDYAFMQNVNLLIRGMRDDIDFNFERSMFKVNITQKGIDEILLFSHPDFEHISSSAVKELQRNQGDITNYVDLCVKQAMEVDLSGVRIFGITGQIGAGKTYVANKICTLGRSRMAFYNVELDVIARDLLTKDQRPFAQEMRKKLIDFFGRIKTVDSENSFISSVKHRLISSAGFASADLKLLKREIFSSIKKLFMYNLITKEPILTEARHQMNKPGFYLLNSALLAEGELSPMCNNNVLMVQASEDFRMKNLKDRNYSDEDLKSLTEAQMTGADKINALQLRRTTDSWGTLVQFVNGPELNDSSIESLVDKMLTITNTD
jgi:pantetheine-phosphate adenylyltransferase